jgi:CheY-like chemotaxis protein
MAEATKILVVEDNDFVRIQVVRFLGEGGYEVVETADGLDALQKISAGIALAVVDVRMEPIDGFEFIRSIRGKGMETPVILVTGDHNPDLLNEAGKWGVAAVLMKPVNKDRLLKTVAKTLESRKRAS